VNLSKYHSCDECGIIREDVSAWFLVYTTPATFDVRAVVIRPWNEEEARQPGVHDTCTFDHALKFAQLFRSELEASIRSAKERHHDTEEETEQTARGPAGRETATITIGPSRARSDD
jgi:hypothetical protein